MTLNDNCATDLNCYFGDIQVWVSLVAGVRAMSIIKCLVEKYACLVMQFVNRGLHPEPETN